MSSIEALKEKARRHEQNEEWQKALDLYRQAIQRLDDADQPDIGLHNRLGDLETRLGNLEAAMRAYDQAVDLYMEAELPNNAIAVCKKILRNMPTRTSVFLRMGQIRAGQGFLVDARQNFLTYAERMQAEGEIDEAFRALVEFADSAPDDAEIRLAIAGQLEQHERAEEAVEQLAHAHRILSLQERDEEAEAVLDRVRELDPDADLEALTSPPPVPEPTFVGPGGGDGWTGEEPMDVFAGDEAVGEEPGEGAGIAAGAGPVGEGTETHAGFEPPEESDPGMVEGFEATHLGPGFDEPPEEEEEPAVPDATVSEEEAGVEAGSGEEWWGEEGTASETVDEVDAETTPVLADPWEPDEDEIPEDAAPLPLLGVEEGEGHEAWAGVEAETGGEAEEPDEEPGEVTFAGPEAEAASEAEEARERAMEDAAAEAAVEEEPAAPSATPRELLEEGRRAAAEGRDDAADLLSRAAGAFGDENDTDGALAAVHALVDHEPDVVGHRQRLVELAFTTDDADLLVTAYLGLAACMERNGEDGKARAIHQQVLSLDPGNETARAALAREGVAQEPVGEVASSEEYVDLGSLILDDEGSQKTTRFVVAYEEPSGDEAADFAKMLTQFKKKVAENLDVDDVKAHHDLGTAYKEMGLLDEAIEEFQAAIRASGGHLPTYELLGQCFLEKGEPEAAVRTLNRALEAPHAVEDELLAIYYTLGRAYEALGNTASAVEFYDRVFSLDINFADVTERLRSLR